MVQPDGKILAGGIFDFIGGQPRNDIARLDGTSGLADSFNPNAWAVLSMQSRCKRTARFWWAALSTTVGGQTRHRIARLDATTGLADSFNPNPNSAVYAIAVQMDGKILVGGQFTTFAPNGGTPVTRTASCDESHHYPNLARWETSRHGFACLLGTTL